MVAFELINKKHLKNVGPIRHCEPPHAHSPGVATVARRTPPAHRCPRQRRRQQQRQRQRVTERTATAPQNGPKNPTAKCCRFNCRSEVDPTLHQFLLFLSQISLKHAIHFTVSGRAACSVDKYASTRCRCRTGWVRRRIVSSSSPIYNANTQSGQEGWTAAGRDRGYRFNASILRCISNIRCMSAARRVY